MHYFCGECNRWSEGKQWDIATYEKCYPQHVGEISQDDYPLHHVTLVDEHEESSWHICPMCRSEVHDLYLIENRRDMFTISLEEGLFELEI